MSKINLTSLQTEKANLVSQKILEKLNTNEKRVNIVFKSPTGSGKTLMVSDVIKQIVNSTDEFKTSFIWIAPRKLHSQSKEKLESYLSDDQQINCSYFENLSFEDGILENEILFLNWESINRGEKNNIIKEKENGLYLDNVIKKTIENKRKIILIIDESHYTAAAKNSLNIIEIINPDVSLHVSATPSLDSSFWSEYINVTPEEVKRDNLLVDKIIINEGIGGETSIENDEISLAKTNSFNNAEILNLGIAKREKLEIEFKNADSKIKPLLLIQLPDKSSQKSEQENLINEIESLLSSKDITTENKKLGYYLSEKKINIDNLNQPLDEVEVLIFKQAIALGWDCPRAQILVLFRDIKSFTFEIQTIGRITRFPDPFKGYFTNSDLNNCYIFTNLNTIGVKDSFAKSFLDYKVVFRGNQYKPLNLPSWYRKRQRERTRLHSEFKKHFKEASVETDLKNLISFKNNKVENEIIVESKVNQISDFKKTEASLDTEKYFVNDYEFLNTLFYNFCSQSLSPEYFPEKRSVGRVKKAIYDFFVDEFQLNYELKKDHMKILLCVLSKVNSEILHKTIHIAKEKHVQFVNENLHISLSYVNKWNIPKEQRHSGVLEVLPKNYVKKSILKTSKGELVVQNKLYGTEKAFIKYLETSNKVKWWFKNGEGDGTSFAVQCINKEGSPFPFFVDFIVFFDNNTIGLFDTKSGFTLQSWDIKYKIAGLLNMVNDKKYKEFKVIGGIVSNSDPTNYKGVWKLFSGENIDDLSKFESKSWKMLNF